MNQAQVPLRFMAGFFHDELLQRVNTIDNDKCKGAWNCQSDAHGVEYSPSNICWLRNHQLIVAPTNTPGNGRPPADKLSIAVECEVNVTDIEDGVEASSYCYWPA